MLRNIHNTARVSSGANIGRINVFSISEDRSVFSNAASLCHEPEKKGGVSFYIKKMPYAA